VHHFAPCSLRPLGSAPEPRIHPMGLNRLAIPQSPVIGHLQRKRWNARRDARRLPAGRMPRGDRVVCALRGLLPGATSPTGADTGGKFSIPCLIIRIIGHALNNPGCHRQAPNRSLRAKTLGRYPGFLPRSQSECRSGSSRRRESRVTTRRRVYPADSGCQSSRAAVAHADSCGINTTTANQPVALR
jgi:hypothetical protein